jgi:ferrous iron transport protein B
VTAAEVSTSGTRAPNTSGSDTPAYARFALLGNPNTGKTTLFNRLCGLRARTANFPGTTSEIRVGRAVIGGQAVRIADLPGVYGLDLELPESRICRAYIERGLDRRDDPDAAVIVADASNLARSLVLAGEVLTRRLPTVIALNMIDEADRAGLDIDIEGLSRKLGCPIVAVNARSGEGTERLAETLATAEVSDLVVPLQRESLEAWARQTTDVFVRRTAVGRTRRDILTDRADSVLTHPVAGLVFLTAVMTGLFICIFSVAQLPMDLVDFLFERAGRWLTALIPAGQIQDLAVNGLVSGVAGTVIFLPQICLLFFLICLLEDSGYLARAAFVADRVLRRFGLPGHAFVPLLSAHACAIPAIMSSRLIPDPRDRLVTILVAPLMSCSARLPVYVLLIGFLFPRSPVIAGVAFAGCYALGTATAVLTAMLIRRTVVPGSARPMILELPPYRIPSLRTAALVTVDRAVVFLRNAGTVILAICVVLWWLSAYPVAQPPAEAVELQARASALVEHDPDQAAILEREAEVVTARHGLSQSFIGRIGRTFEPLFAPLGCDWHLTVGILSSFAAREVFVSTMVVISGAGGSDDDAGVVERVMEGTRDDGTPLFTTSTAASLLVFYVLAMQCLPTLAVTRRQAGGWRWALFQLGYMSTLAWIIAFALRSVLLGLGID